MGQAQNEAMQAGIPHHRHPDRASRSTARRMQCVHCKGITEDVAIDPFVCAHCGLNLFVRDHYSRRLGAYQGVCIDAEDPGNVPARKGDLRMSGAEKIASRDRIVPLNESGHTLSSLSALMVAFCPRSPAARIRLLKCRTAITRLNPYSLMSDPCDQSAYTISVRRDDEGRGGSLFMHKTSGRRRDGDQLSCEPLFARSARAKHLLSAGGIGITPFLAQIKQWSARWHWELHYAAAIRALGSYVD